MENNPTSEDGQHDGIRRRVDGRRHSSTRERILREVESRGTASTAELVAETGLHENTVREHLSRLRADGRLRRVRAEVQGRGRPGWLWQAPPADVVNPYAGLALALADTLTRVSEDPTAQARASGMRWGGEIVEQQADAVDDPRALAIDVMRQQGFAPEVEGEDIVLHRCPLLAAAARRTDVVCAVHEGMLAGIVGSRDPQADARLLPFQADGACILRLRAAS
ncbi:metalloregulator ArsR/SmtB family transcription factor [Microbacterium sp. W4I4]|uniref:helix-turn-helix transcriptional regulator n=1 Tax=Microbacterium sp. W4I4 TaxID=3042295 RepID=UPI0027D7E6A9|nr:winged helix-turn-helix transcriptional regulator [Microbacterium sp. W4I4]